MKKLKTISIGIAAYNEARNIGYLVDNLLEQDFSGVHFKEIIIISDGSTDETVSIVRTKKSPKVKIIDRKTRIGAMLTQNEIVRRADSDILIMLDADVLPLGKSFVQEITKPLMQNKLVGLVGGDTESLRGGTLFEKVIVNSHEFKKNIYKKINNGNNIYLCHGRARALSKNFYKKIVWPNEEPEDAFSYLACIVGKFEFSFVPSAVVVFRSPTNFSDHFRQSLRFMLGKKNLEKIFGKTLISHEYKIEKKLLLSELLKYIIKDPLHALSYLAINAYIQFLSLKKRTSTALWSISKSSKQLK